MSFLDPTTITVNSIAIPLNKIRDDGLTSEYMSSDQSVNLVISHQRLKNKRIRTLLRMQQTKSVTNPLTGQSVLESATFSTTIDRPPYGWTAVDLKQAVDGLYGLLSQANVTKLYGLEH